MMFRDEYGGLRGAQSLAEHHEECEFNKTNLISLENSSRYFGKMSAGLSNEIYQAVFFTTVVCMILGVGTNLLFSVSFDEIVKQKGSWATLFIVLFFAIFLMKSFYNSKKYYEAIILTKGRIKELEKIITTFDNNS